MKFIFKLLSLLMISFTSISYAETPVLNVYTWAGEIPSTIIQQFEKETGIKVNYSTYDNNEIMYTKLRTNDHIGYDIIEPSNYYAERMIHLNMLEKLDKKKLPNLKNIDPFFTNQPYDPNGDFSIPYIWGTTGIFYNHDYFTEEDAQSWANLTNKKYTDKLLMMDDSREVFTVGLHLLGYSINDKNPKHIQEAYRELKKLLPNIRLFNMDAMVSIMIDEDALIGQAMSGDFYNAHHENPKLRFIFPKEGFSIWIDNFAILNSAPNKENAYKFLNFLLRPDISRDISLSIGYSTTNLAAQKMLPADIRDNPVLYPSHETLKRGEIQRDIGEEAFGVIEMYWEKLKMSS